VVPTSLNWFELKLDNNWLQIPKKKLEQTS